MLKPASSKTALSFSIFFILCFNSLLQAQPYQVDVKDQPTYFAYAEATRIDGKLKVLFISSHIIRMKNSKMPSIDIDLELDFDERVAHIPYDEKFYNNDVKDIAIRKVGHEDIYGNYGVWNLTWKHYGAITHQDNTLSALEKIRESVIKDYQSKGYRVYQLDFSPNLRGGLAYNYNHVKLGKYVNWEMERVSPLSPLWIPFYKKGEIRQLLAGLSDSGSGGGSSGGITIENKEKDKSNNNNNGGSTPKKVDNTDWAAVVAVKRMEAEAYEAEGDRLNKLGTMFMMQALQNYRRAQATLPSPRVEQKIKNIESQLILAQAMVKGLDNMEKGAENIRHTLDQGGIPRFRAGQFSYSGFSTKGNGKTEDASPWLASFTYGFYRIFAMEAGMYYAQSPVYQLYLENSNDDKVGQTIHAYQKIGGFNLSGGLALPIKSNVIYALYGWNIPFAKFGATLLTPGYEYPDIKDHLNVFKFQGYVKLGIHLRIPKTNIGMGIHYTLNTIKGSTIVDEDSPWSEIKQGSATYYVGGSEIDKYQFNQLGVSFLILQKQKK